MKKIIIALLMSLLIPTLCSSTNISMDNSQKDSLIWITPTQLKQTNLLLLERQKLLQRDSILSQQVLYLEEVYRNYNKIDSLRKIQLDVAKQKIEADSIQMVKMDKKIAKSKKKLKRRTCVMGAAAGVAFVLGCLFVPSI